MSGGMRLNRTTTDDMMNNRPSRIPAMVGAYFMGGLWVIAVLR